MNLPKKLKKGKGKKRAKPLPPNNQYHHKGEIAFRKAVELDPTNSVAWMNLGITLTDKVDKEHCFRKAVELDPANSVAWGVLGEFLGDKVEKEQCYRKSLELDPNSSILWGNLGVLLEDKVEKEQCYRMSLELDPNNSIMWTNLGNILTDQAEIEQCYRKAIELNPDYSPGWSGLGNVLEDVTEKENCYKKAIELDPNNAYAWNGLGIIATNEEERGRYIRKALEVDPHNATAWMNLGKFIEIYPNDVATQQFIQSLELEENSQEIQAVGINKLKDDLLSQQPEPDAIGSSTETTNVDDRKVIHKVFIVHGHDKAMKETVARTLEKLGLEVIVLHEKPSQGKTIIEKIEANSDVGFALILLSPDDKGGKIESKASELQPRARQNVIFEFGYFVGQLRRDHVIALVKGGDLEKPSDIDGIVYIPFDDQGGWKMDVVKELNACGYSVTSDKLIN